MSVARPLLRALLRAESAWRRAAQEKQRSASAAASAASATSSSFEPENQGASTSTAPTDNTLLRFREPMDTSAWQRGRHGWALGGESYHLEAARASLGGNNAGGSLPLGPPSSGTFRGAQLRRLILSNFRAAEAASRQGYSDLSAAEDAGFAALRALGEQRAMERCSSDSVCANGVRVEATAALVAALPCSSSRAFVSGSGGSMRSVTSAGPGVIVITNVQEEGNSSEDEDEDRGDEESDDDDDSRALSSSSSSSAAAASLAPSPAPEMRYVFTYRLRITNTNPPLLDEDDGEDGSESGDDDGDENDDDEAEGGEEEKGGAPAAAAATEPETGAGTTTTTPGLRVQLLTRGWQIRDSSGRLHAAVPKGSPGVVGCTPVLSPGETFEYYSSTDLPTPAGVMSGSFGMTVVGVGGSSGSGGGGSGSSSSSSGGGGGGGGESGRSKRRRKRKVSSPPPAAPLLSTVASRRFDAVVAPFALRADPLKR